MSIHLKKRCVFLDRDGVINEPVIIDNKPYAPKNIDQFKIFSEIIPLLKNIRKLGFVLVVITNQPDISTKNITFEQVNEFHKLILKQIPISKFYVCKHLSKDNCSCRKPKPGLIRSAIKDFNIEPQKSYFIGDRWRDIDLANSMGCFSIFVDYNYDEKLKTKPNKIVESSAEACELILSLEVKNL